MWFHRILDYPWVYRLMISILAPGARAATTREIARLLACVPRDGCVFDVACGPSSCVAKAGIAPIGIDISVPYVKAYTRQGRMGVVGAADALPVLDESACGLWCVGLLHHLPDPVVGEVLGELLRVCRPGGYVAIVEGVLPKSAWRRPLAYAIRRLDRGRFMREQQRLEELLPDRSRWKISRFSYSPTRLERLICWITKEG